MKNAQIKLQKFGSFLSSMIMPNIIAFIAWGFIAALFIPAGWLPNAKFNELVAPTLNYLLPLLVAYTGGKQIYNTRGGVVAATATMGLIIGSDITMFLGAMIIGPLSAYLLKKIDGLYEGKVAAGFEMLVSNFAGGFFAGAAMLICMIGISPLLNTFNAIITSGVNFLVAHKLMPLTSIFMEPASVLFLNNAVNFGVLTPIGYSQVAEAGKSMMFLIANPGVGLGILLSYAFFGKGNAKKTAPGAIIIHFLGGIWEIYFPYVLMNPLLIIANILGGMSGIITLMITKAGMIGPSSPGSIFAIMAVTPKGSHFGILSAITIATIVTFVTASLIQTFTNTVDDDNILEEMQNTVNSIKEQGKITPKSEHLYSKKQINKIIFACDAGMGSSAMGASLVKKKAKKIGLNIPVSNIAIHNLQADENTLVITQENLLERAKENAPNAQFFPVKVFLPGDQYDNLLQSLKRSI